MSLAENLRGVLDDAATALRAQGTEDTAEIAARAAAVLGRLLDAGAQELAEFGALALVDHLFRGSAAAGAVQSLPAVPERPAEPAAPAAASPASKPKPAEGDDK